VLNKNKNKINRTISLESIDMLPGTPESGAPQDGGNLLHIIQGVSGRSDC